MSNGTSILIRTNQNLRLAATVGKLSLNPCDHLHPVHYSRERRIVSHLLREAALVIEWSAASVPQDFLWELAVMQRELMAWKKVFPVRARNLLALQARHQSDRVLQMSGLLSDWEENYSLDGEKSKELVAD